MAAFHSNFSVAVQKNYKNVCFPMYLDNTLFGPLQVEPHI